MRKNLKIFSKKGTSFILALALIIAYFMPIVPVFATSNTTTLSINFRGNNANYGKVQYSLNDGASWIDVTENIENRDIVVVGDNLRLKIVPNENYSVDYAGIEMLHDTEMVGGLSTIGLENANGYAIPSNVQSVSLNRVEFRAGDNGNNNQNNITSKVVVDVSGDDLEYGADWTDEEPSFVFGINGSQMNRLLQSEVNYKTENNDIVGYTTKDEINYSYNYSGEETVTFNIGTQWDIVVTSLIINDDTYNTPRSKAALSSAYQGGGIWFDVLNVPYAEKYEIEVVARKQTDEEKILGNFAWTYDPNTNQYSDDDKIPNGKLEFVEAKYNDITYNSIQEVNEAGGLFNWEDGVKGTNHPEGNATFPTGTELTIRLIPDSGYQLTSFDLNGFPFETGDEVGLYTFTIGGGNWHLGAHFTEVNDEVKPNSVNINSGSIDIAGGFENGTAKLEVNDVASMAPNRMEGFESKATDEGYDIENYLDISLYNSIYKGGLKDANGNYESWDTPVESIEDKATIILELENDMRGKELAVIHEKHTGNTITGYELIDATYNKENNTITFETDSFSNYAIVSKENTETEKYILTSGNITFTFTDEANHDFEVTLMDALTLADEELESLGLTKEEFAQILNIIKENTAKYGTLLSVYAIEIEDANLAHTGKTEIKIKMTDEMKKYNTFKLIYLDDENNFKVEDIVDLKVNGEYIEGTLPHLSAYALVGDNVETETTTTETTDNSETTTTETTDNSKNPKTGDNIIMTISIFAVATLGAYITLKLNRNRYMRKH